MPNNRVIYMTLEEYLNLTDDEVQFLVAFEYGTPINNAFHGSAVDTKQKPEEEEDEEELENKELPEVNSLEKFQNLDSPGDMG